MINFKQSQVMEVLMSREGNSLMFGIGVLAGVTAGIIAGILLAPASGEESRKKLEEKVSEIAENCPSTEETKRQVLETVDVVQFKIEKAIDRVKNAIKARQLAKAKDKEQSVYGI